MNETNKASALHRAARSELQTILDDENHRARVVNMLNVSRHTVWRWHNGVTAPSNGRHVSGLTRLFEPEGLTAEGCVKAVNNEEG